MRKHKQIVLISFLGLLAVGLLAISGQSQPPAARRVSGLGLQRHASSHARPRAPTIRGLKANSKLPP